MGDFATFRIKLQETVSTQLQKIGKRFKATEKDISSFEKEGGKSIAKTKTKLSSLNNAGRLLGARNGMAAFSSSSRLAASGMNPLVLGLGLAAVGAFKLGVALVQSSAELESNLQVTNQLLGGTAQQTKRITSEATALSKVYGDDYTSTVQAASKLATKFGIDNIKAFDLLKKGYASGANLGGDMLDTIEDSATAFKKLGATADQQIAILQQSVSKGIKDTPKLLESFNDNLPNLGGDIPRLLDQNFGKGFSKNLKANLKTGEATAIDALKAISTAVGQTPLAQGGAESLAQQIFGDSSGSAVELLKNFSSFDTNLDNLVAKNSEFNKSKDQQLQLEKQLATAQLRSSKAFAQVGEKVKVFGLKMKIAFFGGLDLLSSMYTTISPVIGGFVGLATRLSSITGLTLTLKTAWTVLSTAFSTTFTVLKTVVGGLFTFIGNAFNAINSLIDRVIGSSFVQKMKAGFNNIKVAIGNMFSYIQTPLTRLKDALAGIVEVLKGIKNFDFSQIKSGFSEIKSGLTGATDQKRQKDFLNSKKIGQEIGNAQSKVLAKMNKEDDLFKTTPEKTGLSQGAKSQLTGGVNSIVAGGSQVRNVTISIAKMIENIVIHSSVEESTVDIERKLTDMLVKIVQGGETTLNRG